MIQRARLNDSDLDYFDSIAAEAEEFDAEFLALEDLQPAIEPMSLEEWEERHEAHQYFLDYGAARTAEDYAAKHRAQQAWARVLA